LVSPITESSLLNSKFMYTDSKDCILRKLLAEFGESLFSN